MATTYYFNTSDVAVSDPNNVWTDDANGFDGSTSTFARTSTIGSTSSNYIMGEGTDAPTSGGTITQVRARANVWGTGIVPGKCNCVFYTNGLAESLGSISLVVEPQGWTSYIVLTAPSGGWTWQKINDLEIKAYLSEGSQMNLYRAEIEVESVTLSDRYTNDPTRNVGARTTHDPTVAQGGAPPAATHPGWIQSSAGLWSFILFVWHSFF